MDKLLAEGPREGLPDGVEELLLPECVPGQEQPEDRGHQQQHREQAEEREVGDPRGEQVALDALVATAGPGQVVEPGKRASSAGR